MGTKHIPQRTCIACRTVQGKREFLRIVRTAQGHVEADPTGKKSGRGAYLCRHRECWETALNSRGFLEQALRLEKPIDSGEFERLREFSATLPARAPSSPLSNRSGEQPERGALRN